MHQKPPVWITRPSGQNNGWTEALRAAGWDAHTLPTLQLQAFEDTQAKAGLVDVVQFDALMFVSQAAVQYGIAKLGVLEKTKPLPRFWCTGPGTRRALLEYGANETQIDSPAADAAQWDSEALWERVKEQVTTSTNRDRRFSILILRGADTQGQSSGRGWLHEQLLTAGAKVSSLCVYQRIPLAQSARDGVWILTSSFAVEALTGAGWEACDAIATHERIALAARSKGFRRVRVCKPDLAALLECLERHYGGENLTDSADLH